MDVSLFVFLFIVLVFTVRGYKSGLLLVISRLVSLPVAYLLAWLLSKPVGNAIQSADITQGLLAYIIAGAIVFGFSYLIITGIFSLIHKLFIQTDKRTSQLISIGGGILGGVLGVLVGILAIWFSTTMQTIIKTQMGKQHQLSGFEQNISDLTQSTVRKIMIGNEPSPKLTSLPAVLIANPSQNISIIKRITEKGLIQKLFKDQNARNHLNTLSPGHLVNNQSFKRLLRDKDFQILAKEMNFATSEKELEKQLSMQLVETWAKVRIAQEDPKFQAMLDDPELKMLVNSKNVFKLMTSSKVEELMSHLATIKTPEITFEQKNERDNKKADSNSHPKETKIYRWVDENGKVHYSDKKPESNKN